ncbi:helix-turn-helix transcriptional regulator [Flavobacterium sp. RSP15]|uniref:helix-turn-helix transcriptional regulator n=1 Tax=Flavobacterium sp. RSP15 TaxID=2497485 RepID=UPI000F82E7B0|nr:WYL domain-containing protein [Flavobacterium sp. RSP15]RTY86914.1 WYL domain-containing protein [Flavobacterium sp. RSP15]
MSKKQFIKRHHLIINKLRSNPCSFKDLQDHLEKHSLDESENYMISKRTFERDVEEIWGIYKIIIKYQRSQNVYQIIEDADEVKTDRLIESFQIFNALSISDSVLNQIIIEKRKPLGVEHMHSLLHAIKNKFEIQFTHEKFWKANNEKKIRIVYPLALKEARNRWYLIAQDSKDGIVKTFGLDRISNLNMTSKIFIYPNDFNPEEKFQYSFGIISDGTKLEKIKLCLSHGQADYIKSLPLHSSQKIMSENETECVIELFMSSTYDFIMELLSMGQEVQVLEPESLKNKMIEILEATLKRYK